MRKYLLIILSVTFFLLLFSNIAYAIDFKPQVDIGFKGGAITPSSLGNYIKAIYTYAIGVVGILSTAVIIFGGFLWATAAGNNSRVDNAKTWITSALTGLVLALFSYTLLHMINPALVELTPINVTKIGTLEISCCGTKSGPKSATAKSNTDPIQYYCPADTKDPANTINTCAKDQMCKRDKKEPWACETISKGCCESTFDTYYCQNYSKDECENNVFTPTVWKPGTCSADHSRCDN